MTGSSQAVRDLSERLSARAEAVCRHYLAAGRREGRYWLVGDVAGTPGRSLYVRLRAMTGSPGAAGKWSDAATGEHGDLLDLIAANCRLVRLGDVLDEARRFLALPRVTVSTGRSARGKAAPADKARRLFARGVAVAGTVAEAYLYSRSLAGPWDAATLRFHPSCWHWRGDDCPREEWPALLAAVTSNAGALAAVHRTWLARDGADKAPLETPRRTMGAVRGNAIRFGDTGEAMVAGEGLETMLSLRAALPSLAVAACTSASHLAAFAPPQRLKRLYVARDRDAAGAMAFATLSARFVRAGLVVLPLDPCEDDFNSDLIAHGTEALRAHVLGQLCRADRNYFAMAR